MSVIENINELIGQPVLDPTIHKIGKVKDVLVDETGEPQWVAVNTGFFSSHTYVAPLHDAAFDVDAIRIPFLADEVKTSPEVSRNGEELVIDEDALQKHYESVHHTTSEAI